MSINEILASEKYYRKTKKHLARMKRWIKENSSEGEDPDYRRFPMHKKGELILILTPDLYTPEIDSWPKSTNHVSRYPFRNVEFLQNTIAEVIGYSDIPYYDPWEADMKLKCIDDKVRFMDASPDEQNPEFIFVPHPRAFEQFQEFIKYYAANKHEERVRKLLEKKMKS